MAQGEKIAPVTNCPPPIPKIIFPTPGDGACPGQCAAVMGAVSPYNKVCLSGSGLCTYKAKVWWCDSSLPFHIHCYFWYMLDSTTCPPTPGAASQHANDPARTILFDYNFTQSDTFFEFLGQTNDGKSVMRFGNKDERISVKIKYDPAVF